MKGMQLTDNALSVAKKRYFMNGEDWESHTYRVADVNSVAEVTNRIKYREQIHEMIYNMDFLPGGRILRNSGRQRGSLFNCYHL